MPVYNAGQYLREAIDSILQQSFTDFEFVIVNDGSKDESESIILSYSDPRIKYIKNPQNLGLIASLNIGMETCLGEYIVRMDQDDVSLPNRISHQVKFMDENPSYGLIGSWFEDFGDHIPSQIVRYSSDDTQVRIRHLYQTHISHPTAVMRTSVIREHGIRFDPEFVHGEDYNCWVTFSRYSKLSNIPEMLVRKRDHPSNISNKYAQTMHDTCTRVKRKQFDWIGVSISAIEADLYTRFADPEWDFSIDEMNVLLPMLNRLAIANDSSKFIEPKKFRSYLAEKWFNLCYHNINLKGDGWQWFNKVNFKNEYQPSLIQKTRMKLRQTGIPV
jgi:glycosyltransferase involved in cell wall biosynthesis